MMIMKSGKSVWNHFLTGIVTLHYLAGDRCSKYICVNGFFLPTSPTRSTATTSRNNYHTFVSTMIHHHHQNNNNNNDNNKCHNQQQARRQTALFSTSSSTEETSETKTTTATNDSIHTKPKMLSGIRDIVNDYDIFLLDMWGVMHDGTTTYEGVLETISKLKQAKKELIILSNSSKRQSNSIKMLQKLGFDPKNDFEKIITSGEVSYHLLAQTNPNEDESSSSSSLLAPQPWDAIAKIILSKNNDSNQKSEADGNNDNNKDDDDKQIVGRVFCFGSGDGDEEYITSTGRWELSNMQEADLIVARGTFTINNGETVIHKTKDGEDAYFKAYHEQIALAAQRKIPMIVANPDKIRPDADRSPMPGTIGNAYQQALIAAATTTVHGDNVDNDLNMDNLIKYIGKPFSDVYEIALRGKDDKSRACMVGDALETDIAGGTSEGIDTVWVIKDGIHIDDIKSRGYDGNDDDDGYKALEKGCLDVLKDFNKLDDTYAGGKQLSPTFILPHFRW